MQNTLKFATTNTFCIALYGLKKKLLKKIDLERRDDASLLVNNIYPTVPQIEEFSS